ncbi:ARF guanine-nucleotide exchange factor GNL2 [Curcuma longa]|uniref:ARF guanine-nucleotide exchange factor GNL2 n=1 Tax=Curcuma longa TaxID=136217 RepID=UPI003D9F06A0
MVKNSRSNKIDLVGQNILIFLKIEFIAEPHEERLLSHLHLGRRNQHHHHHHHLLLLATATVDMDKTGRPPRRREIAISCMLNAEVGAVLAVIRHPLVDNLAGGQGIIAAPDDAANQHLVHSLKSLRSLLFHPRQWGEWRATDPSLYLSPFLDVIQSDDVPAAATGVALSAILKILKHDVFDEHTPGARDAIHSVVFAITNCRLEHTDPAAEDAVLMRVLQVLTAALRARAAVLLSDHAVCCVVNTCFQVVQQSAQRGDLLQRSARHAMHELVQSIFARLPDVRLDAADDDPPAPASTYGARCMIDIFHFLCSLLNVGEVVVDVSDGIGSISYDEDVQLFALVLINSAIELGGDAIGRHPKILGIVQDDLFHHLIHYSTHSSPLVLSMICSTVLHLYNFLRRCLRLQLEAFFTYVLLRIADGSSGVHLQEVAVEGIAGFCHQPNFVIETYVNYDCDPMRHNVFEELGKLLCKIAFPAGGPMSTMQTQAFEGLVALISTIADNIEVDHIPAREAYNVDAGDYKPFWVAKSGESSSVNSDSWVEFVRMRKVKKKKIMIAANHYNRDDKKGIDFLKITNLVPNPPDPKSFAFFFRYTPGLDKNSIGDFLGDPDEFHIQVLREFTGTFDFVHVLLDTALRSYLETFRLPGESQKIHRIIEAFADQFYEQNSSDIFASKDAVLILSYSLIMLNTDQHNPQVKKKMTEEDFIRNNRAINGGMDLPREYLSELFHSIGTHEIKLSGTGGSPVELSSAQWNDLIKASRVAEPFIQCDYKHKLSREAFVVISGPAVATLAAIFEQADDEELLHESLEGLISIARIARYGLEDVLDQLLSCFCKFTGILNPYATAEETLLTFSNEVKPRMATLALFTIANKFGESIRGAWKNMIDCLLKLKRLKLLPQSLIEPDNAAAPDSRTSSNRGESGVIFPASHRGANSKQSVSGFIGRFSQFLSLDNNDTMLNFGSEFENNLKIIQQCQIGDIFTKSAKFPDESLQNLGRALIFAAAGKGQKFSTPVEEEEIVTFCWDLLVAIALVNIHRFASFWPQLHESFAMASQFPLFSPCPFAEKAIAALFKIAIKLASLPSRLDRAPEELIFKSINLMWKLDKEILDTCCESIMDSTIVILNEHGKNIQTIFGWKTLFHLLNVSGRHPETFDQGVEALIKLMSEGTSINRHNYAFCIEAAFGLATLKISPLEKSSKILSLMAETVNLLVQWHNSGYSDPGSGSSGSNSFEEAQKGGSNLAANLFMKLVEALRKTSLVRREEIRNQAISELGKCFAAAQGLDFAPATCLACFNLVIFAMADDLHEKMLEYSRRENSEREMRSMEGTLKLAMELLVEVFLQFLVPLSQSPGFRTFWLGMLRRMDTCMKEDLGDHVGVLPEIVPALLKKMIVQMKQKEVLVQTEENELWDITNIQIQWIAPSLKDELFPDE